MDNTQHQDNKRRKEQTANEASSSGSTPRSWTYHVFLSFRGEDTRKGFTDHLYASLGRKGITTFKDDKDLERGEVISLELLKAIEESMFAITVLSPNYASSTWCLDELRKIVECKQNLGLEVMPVFYGVDPSDVRHQRGSFEEAFRKHEENFQQDTDKVERWRDALRQVASYSGWDSKDQFEAALVESIAKRIHKKLIPKLPSCTENLVGIASRVENMNSLIAMWLNDVRFIGIWGMGGVGKTTIARSVYEAIQGGFEVSCFLANIREVSQINGLIHKQRELVSHVNTSCSDFYNLYDGQKTIQNCLCNKKVLLVLDDVSEARQLENLAGKEDWFGPGSRVIVTTRDMHLLRIHGVHKTYEVGCLVQNEGLHLFSLKAFKQDQPEEEYLDLAKEVVEYTRGLPLAIEVLGSYLSGRPVDVWYSAIEQIRRVPHPKIQDTLKISYEDLDPTQKNMFLDIACFFRGMKIDEVMYKLENCGRCSKIGIDVLTERSLVYVERWSYNLEMHDLLQEMGRNIVFQESPNDPGRRSRLWSQGDIHHVLTKDKGTEAIQSVVLNLLQPKEARWSPDAFSKTCQLKFLSLRNIQLPLGLNCLPCALEVLHWSGCPLKTLPLTNQQDEVVDIKLSHSKVELLWHGTKFLEKLKYMDLSFSKDLKQLPDFFGVPNLETFVLEGCTSLTEVHPSLVRHKKLVLLNLKDCKSLKAFPCKLEMSSLKELILSGCSEFKIIPSFGESMKPLSVLSLEGTAIRKLPLSLGCLIGLTYLNLRNCKYLISIPDTIVELKSLTNLNISGCSKLKRLPECLTDLKVLDARGTALEELPVFVVSSSDSLILSKSYESSLSKPMNLTLSLDPSSWSQIASVGFRLLPSVWDKYRELFWHHLCHLLSLMNFDIMGNKFFGRTSSIMRQKLPLWPELPSSERQADASNCDSLQNSMFNPSKPRSFFASLVQFSLQFQSVLQSSVLPSESFDMLIIGSKIPSWFAPQECVSLAKIQISPNCPPNEWFGFALCFLLESFACLPKAFCHEIKCYLFRPYGKILIGTRTLPPMKEAYRHLYILYLSVNRFGDRIYEDDYWGEIELALECCCCPLLKIVGCGCRLVCKKEIEGIEEQLDQ